MYQYKKMRPSKNKTRDRHRLVMERIVGRSLVSSEIVHHVSGEKRLDDPSNLELTDRASHARLHFAGVPKSSAHRARISLALRGWRNPATKLNSVQVVEIRRALLAGAMPSELSRRYGVSCGTICSIRDGKNWSYITADSVPELA